MTTTISASWSPVTARQDGQALVHPIANYEVAYYTGNPPNHMPSFLLGASATQTVIEALPNGPLGIRVRAIDTQGTVGRWTAWANGDTSAVPPESPGDFVVSFDV